VTFFLNLPLRYGTLVKILLFFKVSIWKNYILITSSSIFKIPNSYCWYSNKRSSATVAFEMSCLLTLQNSAAVMVLMIN